MTSAELRAKADALENELAETRKQAVEAYRREKAAESLSSRLVYAATARCPCGLGLAYDPAHEDPTSVFRGPSYWDCSGIILGTADKTVQHTDRLPFAFYEVKSEGQASANGATTRPK